MTPYLSAADSIESSFFSPWAPFSSDIITQGVVLQGVFLLSSNVILSSVMGVLHTVRARVPGSL